MRTLSHNPVISVIIPTLNEAAHIDRLLTEVLRGKAVEVLVVDGGSEDATTDKAAARGVRVCRCPAGRARQMNWGAALAQGEVFFFLHADSRLPAGYGDIIRRALAGEGVAAGAFSLGIDADSSGLRFIASCANLRSRSLGLPYGDQGLFLRADRFQACGGFPELPIMEDVVMVRRLRKTGRIVTVPERIRTSSRRWERLGVLRTTLINQAIVAGFALGIPAARLAAWYRRFPPRAHP
jgi:rSAM/selenodomain-associated transferase 2